MLVPPLHPPPLPYYWTVFDTFHTWTELATKWSWGVTMWGSRFLIQWPNWPIAILTKTLPPAPPGTASYEEAWSHESQGISASEIYPSTSPLNIQHWSWYRRVKKSQVFHPSNKEGRQVLSLVFKKESFTCPEKATSSWLLRLYIVYIHISFASRLFWVTLFMTFLASCNVFFSLMHFIHFMDFIPYFNDVCVMCVWSLSGQADNTKHSLLTEVARRTGGNPTKTRQDGRRL